MTDELTERLLARPVGPTITKTSVREPFTREIEVSTNTISATITDHVGVVNEGTALKFLEEEGQNPDEWEVTHFRKLVYGNPAAPYESVKFSFKRKGSTAGIVLPDLDDLHRAVRRSHPKPPLKVVDNATVVGVLADAQTGKVSERGGVEELLHRLEDSRKAWQAYVRRVKPAEIVLVDDGDAIENFENTGAQDRTNDLQLTEQIRVWRRVFWTWIDTAASLAPSVKVVSVPSNHCRVRRGKADLGPPSDDYGIEVLTQLADMAAVHPDKYGHVSFYAPDGEQEAVAIPTVGGKVLGFAHGHQVSRPEKLADWLAGQALGRTPIGQADIAVFGHWHHLRIQTVGDDRWLFIAPTSDNGSSWFRNLTGNESAPGVLTFTVDSEGWGQLHVC